MNTVPTLDERREIAAHWTGDNAAQLQELLDAGDAAGFDTTLLEYMRARCRNADAPRYYFSPQEANRRAQYIKTQIPYEATAIIEHADAIMAGNFPFSSAPGALYNVPLAPGFSWQDNPPNEPQFPNALNRHRFWMELAMAYHFTGEESYIGVLREQFFSWARESQPVPEPSQWREAGRCWGLLDAAIRADTWVWTYFLLLESPSWTPDINTLFIHRLWQHARFLAALTPRGGGNNWVVMQSQGMLNIALQFPEWSESKDWEEHASSTLIACLAEQFHEDGGHFEQSPSYHAGCIRWFIEPFYLARLNGRGWMEPLWPKLRGICEFYFQLLLPDGKVPNLSDSDYTDDTILTSAAYVLDEPQWTRFRPVDARSVWLCGTDKAMAWANRDRSTPRPTAVAFPASGYYFLRSGDDTDALQISFDCGPRGHYHGHLDLLNITLYGFGRQLICDPGRLIYSGTPERQWVLSTPAHNTISIDGQNHAQLEGVDNPGFKVTEWEVLDDGVLISAEHKGYAELEGAPRVGRTLWFDRRSTLVLLDWGASEVEHEYTTSFTLPGTDVSALDAGVLRSTRGRGNVQIQSLLLPGQNAVTEERFWSPAYGESEPATRLTISQKAKRVVFATVITAYEGREPPLLKAILENDPLSDGAARLCLRGDEGEKRAAFPVPVWLL